MIDYLAIAITHALLMLAAWRMMNRADLDREDVAPGTPVHGPNRRRHAPAAQMQPGQQGGARHV